MNDQPMSAPPAWRPPPGEVETHVPTMSTAERLHGQRKPPSPFTTFELSILRAIDASPRRGRDGAGQLTLPRLFSTLDLGGYSELERTVQDLVARGHLQRRRGRGGPYALAEHVKALLS